MIVSETITLTIFVIVLLSYCILFYYYDLLSKFQNSFRIKRRGGALEISRASLIILAIQLSLLLLAKVIKCHWC